MNPRAVQFLRERLISGDRVQARELSVEGARYGFSHKTLLRAARHLHVEFSKESYSGPWLWFIPEVYRPVEIKGRMIYPDKNYRYKGEVITGAEYIARNS